MNTTIYILNRVPTKSLHLSTPLEKLSNEKPNISHLKIFGSPAYFHIPKQKRQKLDSTSTQCIFVGYGINKKGVRLYDPSKRDIILSRNVHILESLLPSSINNIVETSNYEENNQSTFNDNLVQPSKNLSGFNP